MCYSNSYVATKTQIYFANQIIGLPKFHRDFGDGFAYWDWPVIVNNNGNYVSELMEWGFIPGYLGSREEVDKFRRGYKDATGKFRPSITTLNAIAEEMLEKPMYREAAANRRCLVLSSGFYEWRHIPKIGKRGEPLKAVEKIPHYITLKNTEYFFMAGIWQSWTDKNTGEQVNTFAICTTKANELMAFVHNTKKRMPLILSEDQARLWLNNLNQYEIRSMAEIQIAADQMTAHPVAKNFKESINPMEPFEYNHLQG